MYLAELHGKLPSKTERMEDILTSNVYSFFKYSNRRIFLKGYLNGLGFGISSSEAFEAEFKFWPQFEDNTEPDLIIIVGDYYLLIEAKFFSDFAAETKESKAQLIREIEGGDLEAKNYGKKFKLIAITADHYQKKDKFEIIPKEYKPNFKWTNWQNIASYLDKILSSEPDININEYLFASDLYNLLVKKNLRDFQDFSNQNLKKAMKSYETVYFNSTKALYGGRFVGFINCLPLETKINPIRENIFYKSMDGEFNKFSGRN